MRIKATHIYTDYWTCDSIAFVSREQIICGVVDGRNRYAPYTPIVKADPNAAYVFLLEAGKIPTFAKRVMLLPGHYQQFIFGNYVVYQPVNTH